MPLPGWKTAEACALLDNMYPSGSTPTSPLASRQTESRVQRNLSRELLGLQREERDKTTKNLEELATQSGRKYMGLDPEDAGFIRAEREVG